MTGEQETDRINLRVVGLCALVIGGVTVSSVWGAAEVLGRPREREAASAVSSRPSGMLESQPFDEPGAARVLLEEKTRRLVSYGWVDADAGLVHIPIERAMELTAGGGP
jgi:hypothetical protein